MAVWALLFGTFYILTAELGFALSFEQGNVATFWPASGLFLAVLLWQAPQRWPVFIAVGALADLAFHLFLHNKPISLAIGLTSANTVVAVIGAAMLRWRFGGEFSLKRLPDVCWLLITACVAPMVSATIAAFSSRWSFPFAPFDQLYYAWWIANSVGILIAAPLTWCGLTCKSSSWQWPGWKATLEPVASLTASAIGSSIVFFNPAELLSFPFLLLPLLLWPALRIGTVGVAANVGIMAVIITLATQLHAGPFFHGVAQPALQALYVQAFLAASAAPFLVLAAMWHERKEAAEEMERRIQQRTRQLAEADQRKDHFLAVLAHELRNPLSPLSHALEIWPSVRSEPEKLEELRSIMANQVRHMTGLIDDLLDVSRIAGGKLLLRKEDLNVCDVVCAAVRSIEGLASTAGRQVQLHLPEQPLFVHGDRARLEQIVGNLLHNAVKYTDDDGKIDVIVEGSEQSVQIAVCDNGPGIPQQDLERIFDLFAQVDQTLERSHGGLGIGLTLVKNLVSLHGGHVEAFSEGVGCGSKFQVTLPRIEPPAKGQSAVPAAARPLPHRRILVVDDTRASGRMLTMLLKNLGQEAELRFDGPSALEAAASMKPDVIFLDIAMPGMSGYEVAQQLKGNPATRNIVLVAVTGFGQESDRLRAFAAGFDHHIVKPASLASLTRIIGSLRDESP
ncbi:MAG: MASE1 domain-containing protein [Aureliella sp.]